MTRIVQLSDEMGNVDLCEVEENGTRVVCVIERIKTGIPQQFEDRSYVIQYQHACGYRD